MLAMCEGSSLTWPADGGWWLGTMNRKQIQTPHHDAHDLDLMPVTGSLLGGDGGMMRPGRQSGAAQISDSVQRLRVQISVFAPFQPAM